MGEASNYFAYEECGSKSNYQNNQKNYEPQETLPWNRRLLWYAGFSQYVLYHDCNLVDDTFLWTIMKTKTVIISLQVSNTFLHFCNLHLE